MEQLVARAKSGDAQAIDELYTQYKGLVNCVAHKFFLVGGDVQDLVQEGMIGLFVAINKYDEQEGPFPAFARLCVTRQILAAVRHSNGVRQRPLFNAVELDSLADKLADTDDPLDILLQKEENEQFFRQAKRQFTPLENEVVSLFAEGYSYEDIGEKLHKSAKSVDGAMQRARNKLLKLL